MGPTPMFEVSLKETFNYFGATKDLCWSSSTPASRSKLSLPFANTKFAIAEFDFQAIADAAEQYRHHQPGRMTGRRPRLSLERDESIDLRARAVRLANRDFYVAPLSLRQVLAVADELPKLKGLTADNVTGERLTPLAEIVWHRAAPRAIPS